MYSINSVEDLQELNPYIIVGCGGGGEKFSNLEGIETVGFLDDNPAKQGKPFCGLEVASNLSDLFESTEANTVAIMLPIGAEGTALKYAVQALANGKNAVVSFRSLSLSENESLLKLAEQNDVCIKEISPRLDVVRKICGVAPEKCCEVLPKISYEAKAPVIFVGGTSQECGKRTTTKSLGIEAMKRGMKASIISTDEMGLEQPTAFNFRAGSLSAMDIPSAILSSIKYVEENDQPDIIFIEGQSSLTEDGNPHPRGLSACILIGADPDAVIVGHRPNHPYREPRGIDYEVKAIEAVVPTTKVVGLSINLRNADEDMTLESFEEKYGLPAADMYFGGAAKILDAILEYLDKN
ncbi:DUF1611 domain-containing protein [Methanobrevibacter sp.]|uniref:DUF1611 domain-containing protein n=1 Tax=Methanobrevibacter sp. TaxID=66852 RepID=UPI0025E95CFC|nr:DUF1611 domain-containing protein [uncultured Methanobrevibacter sp.]